MIDDDLSPSLRALFDAEKRRDGPPAGAKDRVSHALGISLGIGIGAAAAGSASAGSVAAASKGVLAASTAASASVTTTAATAAAAGAGMTATGGALAKGLAFALVTAMAGTTGTGIYLAARDDAKPVVVDVRQSNEVPSTFDPSLLAKKPPPVAAPLAAPIVAPVITTVITPPATQNAPARSVDQVSPSVPVTPEQRAERLRGERAVLDTARAAVSRGDGGAALIALEAHRSSYAGGALSEERDALTVLALVKLGRVDAAKHKAEAFRSQNPHSLFLPAIDGALR